MNVKKLHPTLQACVVAFVLTAIFAAGAVALYGPPRPRTHDEFSYVLAGDTFASGRLSNPTHPLSPSFETFHVLSKPSYASKYHPAQGLMLALGQVFFGRQWVGVWISCGLASAAIVWMVAAVASARASMLAGVLASAIVGLSYWAYSYWGGAVAAAAGALVVGALLRGLREPRPPFGAVFGFGTILLVASRPFEGGFLLVACGVFALSELRKASASSGSLLRNLLLPTLGVVALGASFLLFYNFRVTGNPLVSPYLYYENQSSFGSPIFLWSKMPAPPTASAKVFEDFTAFNRARLEWVTGRQTMFIAFVGRLVGLLEHYFLLPLGLVLPLALLDRTNRRDVVFSLATLAIVLVPMLCNLWSFPHYLAPLTGLLVLLHVRALGVVAGASVGGRRIGKFVAIGLVAAAMCASIVDARAYDASMSRAWHQDRYAVERQLKDAGGRHLVFVRYGEPHDFLREWVENRADIDSAPVIFARELDRESNERVRAYFSDRHAWVVTVTDGHYELRALNEGS